MMNGGMPASGANMGQMGGQMGMNPMVMGRMPMGPDQVGADAVAELSADRGQRASDRLDINKCDGYMHTSSVRSAFASKKGTRASGDVTKTCLDVLGGGKR